MVTVSIQDVIQSACFAEGDYLQKNKMRYTRLAKDVFMDMNLDTVKMAQRAVINIDKRTNTIRIPDGAIEISGVSLIDEFGNTYPVYRNDKLHNDLIDIGADKYCNCTCKSELCNQIKGYESITTYVDAKLPNGDTQTFTCISRKSYDSNGFYYEETQTPTRIYEDGVWVRTEVVTTSRQLCKLELDNNGCVVDCDANWEKVDHCCAISSCCGTALTEFGEIPVGGNAQVNCGEGDTWLYSCSSQMATFNYKRSPKFSIENGSYFSLYNCGFPNIYNINEEGNRLIFPSNFGFGRVLLRWFTTPNLKNLTIPFQAKDTFITGLLWFDSRWKKDYEAQKMAALFGQRYANEKLGTLKELNKYRIAEIGQIIAPKVYIPSYIIGATNYYGEATYYST